jgi:ribosomal protein S18 acetylase RimI-like enzyme
VARDADGAIVGVSTLAVFPIPTARRAWVEDVIVDEAVNGQGIGRQLTEAMLVRARELGCKTVDLTSRPSREAANHLYKKVGFGERATNVYRFEVK